MLIFSNKLSCIVRLQILKLQHLPDYSLNCTSFNPVTITNNIIVIKIICFIIRIFLSNRMNLCPYSFTKIGCFRSINIGTFLCPNYSVMNVTELSGSESTQKIINIIICFLIISFVNWIYSIEYFVTGLFSNQ